MKDERPPVIGFILSAFFGIVPGIAYALSLYLSLAIVTIIVRAALHLFR